MKLTAVPPLVIVIAYRADDHLDTCLAELEAAGGVVVVDNDANPQTRALVERHAARYLAAPRNLGFAGGVNLALKQVWDGKQDVLLLNPDARLKSTVLDVLQERLHSKLRLAAVAPALIGLDGSHQRGSWPMPSPRQVWADALALESVRNGCPVFLVGAVLMLKASALSDLGGLDERYFLYSEEADWQMRARRAGWIVELVEEATVPHEGAASSSDPLRRLRLFHASGELFGRRWYGSWGWQLMRAGGIVAALRRSICNGDEPRRNGLATARLYITGPLRTARRAGLLP